LGFGVDIYSAADAKRCCLALLIVTITSRCNGCVGRGRGVEKGEKGRGKDLDRGSERRERERARDRQREGAGGREVGRGRGGEKGGRESE
jgi:hypothetical protein